MSFCSLFPHLQNKNNLAVFDLWFTNFYLNDNTEISIFISCFPIFVNSIFIRKKNKECSRTVFLKVESGQK